MTENNEVRLWETDLRLQIFLGDSGFVKRMQSKVVASLQNVGNTSLAKRMKSRRRISAYLARRRNRDTGIADAYRKDGYTMNSIADRVDLSVLQVNRIARSVESRQLEGAP